MNEYLIKIYEYLKNDTWGGKLKRPGRNRLKQKAKKGQQIRNAKAKETVRQ